MHVVNLTEIGPVAPRFCTPEELTAVYSVAQEIMADVEPDILAQILGEWSTALTWSSLEPGAPSEEWYYRALLLTCIQGLLGQIQPKFYTIP
jgi:hypothetical protein